MLNKTGFNTFFQKCSKIGTIEEARQDLKGITNVIKEFPFLAGFTMGRYGVEISDIQELPSIIFSPAQNTGAMSMCY